MAGSRSVRPVTRSDPGYWNELTDLTNLLPDHPDLESCLRRVADLAVRAVPACQSAAVVLADPAGARTLAATQGNIWTVASYQYTENQGPGADAIRYGEPRRIDDIDAESRWPGFCAVAAEHGVRSTLALPLRMAGTTSGALTLDADEPRVFDGVSHDLAVIFAFRSGLALSNSDVYYAGQRLIENLHAALAGRAVIEQAKGIVMAREHCTPERAFDILVGVSQRTDQRVRDVAARVVDSASGESPDPA